MIKVLKTGLFSSIQDFGRVGYQQYGVPYAGVMDTYSASIANVLLGNNESDAVLEMTMIGATLQFYCDTIICLAGADMSPRINDLPIQNYTIVKIKKNDVLSFGKLTTGFRCYLAVSGGFKTEKVMKSRSMFPGVTKDHSIKKDDELPIIEHAEDVIEKYASIKIKDNYTSSKTIEVFKGPEFDNLSELQQKQLASQAFTISKDNNRMAYQLEESLENNLKAIITSPVLPGTVQLTPSGNLIVLMRDCQTTGGYPRVLQLKESAMNIMAQKFTGNEIRFNII